MGLIRQSMSFEGFTIIELLAVIITIAILANITLIAYGDWRTRAETNAVKSDLMSAATAMSDELKFNGAYPTSLSSNYTQGSDTLITWASGSASSFCLNGVSMVRTSIKYYINDSMSQPAVGAC